MSTNTTMLTGGVTTTVQQDITVTDLMPNNYLTIVWGDTSLSSMMKDLNIDEEVQAEIQQNLQNALTKSINQGKIGDKTSYSSKAKYINVTGVAKYLAQNTIPAGPKRVAVNALITMAGGSGKNAINEKVTNTVVSVFGNIASKTAHDLGYSDPHETFAGVASEDTIKFFQKLAKNTQQAISDKIRDMRGLPKTSVTSKDSQESGKNYIGLVIGLTDSDTESYEISIPRRKVENGSDYTTHLLPQPFKKEFSGTLTNKLLTSKYDAKLELETIEYVKNKLIEIANSHTTFDIYIRLSNDKMYKKSNVVFSNLSFTKDENNGSGYSYSFTVEPISEFKTQTFVSDRKYFPTGSKSGNGGGKTGGTGSGGSGKGGKGGKPTPKIDNNGKPITVNGMNKKLKLGLKYDYLKFKDVKGAQDWLHSLNSDPTFKSQGGYVLLQHSDDKNVFDIFPAKSIINGVRNSDITHTTAGPLGGGMPIPRGTWKGNFFYPTGSKVGYKIIK